ncbi:ATPase, F1/V1/A1 complex, alpha/beta subunit [Tanacetum coccineum]
MENYIIHLNGRFLDLCLLLVRVWANMHDLDVNMQKGFLDSGGRGGNHKKKVGDKAGTESNTRPVELVDSSLDASKENGKLRSLDTDKPINAKDEVKIHNMEVQSRFDFSLYGYFVGKRLAFSVVEYYVKIAWQKYRIVRVMMNAKGFFFFKLSSTEGMNGVLENGPWFIQSFPIILKKWTPTANLLKEDLNSVPILVKLHDILIVAFIADGLSAMTSKLVEDDEEVLHTVRVEYEWEPPRCKLKKQVYQAIPKKNGASSSGMKKIYEVPRHDMNTVNPFDAFNMIENDEELGSNKGSSNSGKKFIHEVPDSASGSPRNKMGDADINTLTMEQYLALTRENQAPGMVKLEIRSNVNFEIKCQFMREDTFFDNKNDDAYEHLERILDILSLFNILLSPGTINTWDLLKNAFIQRYCPPFKMAKKLKEIHNFKQEGDETLYQAW